MTDVSTQTESQDSFEDLAIAAKLRDIVTRHVIQVIDEQRPALRKGTVTQIDPDIREVRVSFNGATPVRVKVGAIQPTQIGQVVHVQGLPNDLWVVNVIGASALTEVAAIDLIAPTSFLVLPIIGGLSGTWDAVPDSPRYEFNYADNDTFADNISSFTSSTNITIPGLDPGTTYYARVRAANSGDGRGPWSLTIPVTPSDYPNPTSDGIAPTESPFPLCSPMVGALIAEWIAVTNADLVTYDVYASTVSGFTVGPTNFIGSTTGTFYIVKNFTDGTPVPLGVNVFIRIVARDGDGSAPVGPQGFAAPAYVDTGDVGRIDYSKLGDGNPPASSPNAPLISTGAGFLYVQWDHTVNADPITYEVHVSDGGSAFVVSPNTLVGETSGNWFFIRNQGPGANRDALVYGQNYWVKLVAKDADGKASPGNAGVGFTSKVGTVDIAQGAITAASGIIADLAVGTAKIQDAAITTLKVADLAVSTAKIQDLAVSTAKITDLAVNTAKIANLAVTDAKIDTLSATKITAGTIGAHTIILSGINSRLQSDDYALGASGWVMRGDGYFEARSGVFRGSVVGATITGGILQTAASGKRLAITSDGGLTFYAASGVSLGTISAGSFGQVVLTGGLDIQGSINATGSISAGSGSFFLGPTTISATSISAGTGSGFSISGSGSFTVYLPATMNSGLISTTGYFSGDLVLGPGTALYLSSGQVFAHSATLNGKTARFLYVN